LFYYLFFFVLRPESLLVKSLKTQLTNSWNNTSSSAWILLLEFKNVSRIFKEIQISKSPCTNT